MTKLMIFQQPQPGRQWSVHYASGELVGWCTRQGAEIVARQLRDTGHEAVVGFQRNRRPERHADAEPEAGS